MYCRLSIFQNRNDVQYNSLHVCIFSSYIFVSSNYFPKKSWIVACFWFWKTIFCSRSVDFARNSESSSLSLDLAHDRSFCAVCSASRFDIISGALSSSSLTHGTLHWFLLPFCLYPQTKPLPTLFVSILDETHQWCLGKHQGHLCKEQIV